MKNFINYRKPLLMMSTCLVGASLFMVGQGLAQTKNANALSPKGEWAVNKINSGGQSYCAMSRPFDQDIVLTIGRNVAEEYSLAIDFQKSNLNVEKPYKITLQPGPGQIRAYEIMPASKRAMVLRLGDDVNFAKSLQSSNQLKAEIDGKPYVFSVSGFAAASNTLDQCMKELGGAATRVASNQSPAENRATSASQPIIVNAQTANIDTSRTSINIEPDKLVAEKPIMPRAALPVPKPVIAPPAPKAAPKLPVPVVNAPKPIDIARVDSRVTPSSSSVPAPIAAPEVTKIEKPAANSAPKIVMERTRSEVQNLNEPRPPEIQTKMQQVPKPQVALNAPIKTQPPKIDIKREATRDVPPPAPVIASKRLDNLASDQTKTTMTAREARMAVARQNELGAQKNAAKKVPAQMPIAAAPRVEVARVTPVQKQQQNQLRQLQEQNKLLPSSLKAQRNVPAMNVPAPLPVQESIKPPTVSASIAPSISSPKSAPKVSSRRSRETEEERRQRKARLAAASQPVMETTPKPIPRAVSSPSPNKVARAPASNPVVAPSVSPNILAELNKLKAENQRLSSQLNNQETRLDGFDAKNPKADEELKLIRQQMAELQERNRKLADEAMKARGQIDTASIEVGNQAIKKIRAFEKKYEAAKADNMALSKEIEELRRMQEDKTLKAVAGDWDLEKATQRYNEAEREIKRMGMLLEQQRVASRQEKNELEQMLFDPAVTDREQRRKMAELELKLAAAEKALQQRGSSISNRSKSATGVNDVRGERVVVTAANNSKARAPRAPKREAGSNKNFIPSLESKPMSITAKPAPAPARKAVVAKAPERVNVPPPNVPARKISTSNAPTSNVPRAPVAKVSRMALSQQSPSFDRGVSSAPTAPAKLRMASPIAQNTYGQGNLQSLLSSAGIPLTGGIVKNGATQYRWNTGNIVGKGQIIPMAQARNVDAFAQNYITRAKQSCAGDFASLPSPTSGRGKSYEIACISPSRSTSASLVFAEKDGNVIAIAHEAPAESLDAAMDARDRVAAKL